MYNSTFGEVGAWMDSTIKKYPVECYGFRFNRSSDLHDWISDLSKKSHLSRSENIAVTHLYDVGIMAHPDYKYLIRKRVAHD